MADRINDQAKTIGKMQRSQAILEAALALHTHAATFGLGPSVELASFMGIVKIPSNIINFLTSLTTVYNNTAQKVNMSVVSSEYINSEWNKTN